MANIESVECELNQLAAKGTPNDIAAFLTAEGVTGDPGCTHNCVLVQYLLQVTGYETEINFLFGEVQHGSVHVHALEPVRFDLPDVLIEFAHRFDEGDYPALVGS